MLHRRTLGIVSNRVREYGFNSTMGVVASVGRVLWIRGRISVNNGGVIGTNKDGVKARRY